MNALGTLLTFAPVLPGILVVSLLLSSRSSEKKGVADLVLRISLGAGAGVGLASCLYYCLFVFGKHEWQDFLLAQVALAVLAAGANLRLCRRLPLLQKPAQTETRGSVPRLLSYLLNAALAMVALLTSLSILARVLENPRGGWDAWAIWNLRAAFIFRAGADWLCAFSRDMQWSHVNYPLLIPGFIAGSWKLLGYEAVSVPILLSLLFTLCTVGLLMSSIALARGSTQAKLAGLTLMSTRSFIEVGADQYADVPLAYFILAATVSTSMVARQGSTSSAVLCLAALFAGLAAWTKNEGLMFLVFFASIVLVLNCLASFGSCRLRQICWFLAGLAVPAAAIICFKASLNHPVGSAHSPEFSLAYLAKPERYLLAARAVIRIAPNFGHWNFNPLLLLLAYITAAGLRIQSWQAPSLTGSAATIGLMLIGYFLAYVTTTYPLNWHVETSCDRLIIQCWPSILFLLFLITRSPESFYRKLSPK